MTNLDPNPPPAGPRSRTVADRPQTMWMIAAAVAAGAGAKLVGVMRYSEYPPAAAAQP